MTWRRWMAAIGLGALLVGCGAPDREAEATALEETLGGLAGVDTAHVTYVNGFETGDRILIDVTLSDPSEAVVTEVTKTTAESLERDFDQYRQELTITVPRSGATLGYRPAGSSTIDLRVGDVLDDVARAGHLARGLRSTDRQGWSRAGDRLSLTLSGREPDKASIAAIRSVLGDQPAKVDFMRLGTTGTHWTVTFPYALDAETQHRRLVGSSPLPVRFVVVDNDAITRIELVNPADVAATEQGLRALIGGLQQLGNAPVFVDWEEKTRVERRLQGSVDVGGCDYPHTLGEKEPERFLTPEALDLQKRLRTEFDDC